MLTQISGDFTPLAFGPTAERLERPDVSFGPHGMLGFGGFLTKVVF